MQDQGTFPTKYDLTAQFKGRGGEHVPATTVQMLADRLSKSLKRFLDAKELGIPSDRGFPRFKKAKPLALHPTQTVWHKMRYLDGC